MIDRFVPFVLFVANTSCGLLDGWHRNESGPVIIVSSFPNYKDLINGNVAVFPVRVAQMEHTHLNLEHFAA